MNANDLSSWYQVRFDDQGVYRAAQPPGHEPWNDFFAWDDVMRVCLEVEDFTGSDGLYIFTHTRPESYAIPTEAAGGLDLLAELVRRSLFDGELAIEAATAESGLFCWPPSDEPTA